MGRIVVPHRLARVGVRGHELLQLRQGVAVLVDPSESKGLKPAFLSTGSRVGSPGAFQAMGHTGFNLCTSPPPGAPGAAAPRARRDPQGHLKSGAHYTALTLFA
jgi:hypothetical protein